MLDITLVSASCKQDSILPSPRCCWHGVVMVQFMSWWKIDANSLLITLGLREII